MNIFYSVDRKSLLKENHVVELFKPNISVPLLKPHFDEMFPEGISSFGARFLLEDKDKLDSSSSRIEMVFEFVRRLNFPNRPSRLQSFYASMNIDDSISFREKHGKPTDTIWKVVCEKYFVADYNLLNTGPTNLALSYLAKTYWSGGSIDQTPFWEALLIPPVTVLERVA